jgi:hypothetical protein
MNKMIQFDTSYTCPVTQNEPTLQLSQLLLTNNTE